MVVPSPNKIRIGSRNPNKSSCIQYEPISTDGKNICYENNIYEVRYFLQNTSIHILRKLIVLTIKERNLILEALVDFDIFHIAVLELNYPIFSNIKYFSDVEKSYTYLVYLLQEVNELGIKGKSLAYDLSIKYLFQIERKLRFKNTLDYFFAFAYNGGYSEVFKLQEKRSDRVVIALDYNSMFVDCMMDKFLEPKSIRYIKFKDTDLDISQLHNGLYRVVLENPKDGFFKKFHPFKYTLFGKSLAFNLSSDQSVEIMLFKNEIEYYQKFFHSVKIIEGFCTKNNINHPLKKFAKNLYHERLKYKQDNNILMDNLTKQKLIMIHSATNPKRYKHIYFHSKNEMVDYISRYYMIEFPSKMSATEKLTLINSKNTFQFYKYKTGYKAKVVDYESYDSIYSFSSQILANSRLKMIQTIERFLKFDSVEICYCNIDSIHISIKKSEVENFLHKHKDMISSQLGDLKIESITNEGYWLDLGRYWLKNNNKIVMFKNYLFNQKGDCKPYSKNKIIYTVCLRDNFNYVKKSYINIYNTFSHTKKIDTNIIHSPVDKIDLNRYNFNEICNLSVVEKTLKKESLKSKEIKKSLFDQISITV